MYPCVHSYPFLHNITISDTHYTILQLHHQGRYSYSYTRGGHLTLDCEIELTIGYAVNGQTRFSSTARLYRIKMRDRDGERRRARGTAGLRQGQAGSCSHVPCSCTLIRCTACTCALCFIYRYRVSIVYRVTAHLHPPLFAHVPFVYACIIFSHISHLRA